jgi:nitrogen fixation/metabolism regulation signal transduction histidine kinase
MLKETSLSTIALCGLQAALIIVLYALITRTFLGAFDAVQGNRILIMVLVVAFFTLMSGAPGVDARFRVPLMPFLSMLASFSFAGAGRNS